MRPLSDEDLLLLRYLIQTERRWVRPMDLGGADGSSHSRILTKLVKLGLAERRPRGTLANDLYAMGTSPGRKAPVASYEYRSTTAGQLHFLERYHSAFGPGATAPLEFTQFIHMLGSNVVLWGLSCPDKIDGTYRVDIGDLVQVQYSLLEGWSLALYGCPVERGLTGPVDKLATLPEALLWVRQALEQTKADWSHDGPT